MNKSLIFRVVSILVICCICLSFRPLANASPASPWMDAPELYLQKVAEVDQTDIPNTMFAAGNIDCSMNDDGHCSIDTTYGAVFSSSLKSINKWVPIKDFGNNSANFFAIPHSDTSITTSFTPLASYMYFTYNTHASLTPVFTIPVHSSVDGLDKPILDHFQLNHAPDKRLTDRTNKRLAGDINSMAFSGNSEWMVVTSPNAATLRVNVASGEVLPFGRIFIYGNGLNPVPKNAITSDGRWAAIASQDASTFEVYDLDSCSETPDSITKPTDCRSRNLSIDGFISSQIPGYSGVRYMRFLDDKTIGFYASYKVGAATKYAYYLLSPEPITGNHLQYMALGDSYISGEGAFSYLEDTD
ncbi:MAG TPA: hypothetical protein VFS31_07105, partial [Chitinophagaceae bacterium]|nr:hypothetical protein [Chitinophagaceae bacterium]